MTATIYLEQTTVKLWKYVRRVQWVLWKMQHYGLRKREMLR